jgi:hypothetical protein
MAAYSLQCPSVILDVTQYSQRKNIGRQPCQDAAATEAPLTVYNSRGFTDDLGADRFFSVADGNESDGTEMEMDWVI